MSAQDNIWESSNPLSLLELWVFFLGIWAETNMDGPAVLENGAHSCWYFVDVCLDK